jgi:tRNA-(ms[2]io[6]A)-hydroxylase
MRMTETGIDMGPVLGFLRGRTPDAWATSAVRALDSLLADHASLELKAAQQAQRLIWKYGAGSAGDVPREFRARLMHRMSRLAREELRHFEQVLAVIERRGGQFVAISPSRYAGALHQRARKGEPGALTDQLLIGALIEARSCERFFTLLEPLGNRDPELAAFYASLLRSEARHFEDYLSLARAAADPECEARLQYLLELDAELVQAPDAEIRFHGGPPSEPPEEPQSSRSRALSPAR